MTTTTSPHYLGDTDGKAIVVIDADTADVVAETLRGAAELRLRGARRGAGDLARQIAAGDVKDERTGAVHLYRDLLAADALEAAADAVDQAADAGDLVANLIRLGTTLTPAAATPPAPASPPPAPVDEGAATDPAPAPSSPAPDRTPAPPLGDIDEDPNAASITTADLQAMKANDLLKFARNNPAHARRALEAERGRDKQRPRTIDDLTKIVDKLGDDYPLVDGTPADPAAPAGNVAPLPLEADQPAAPAPVDPTPEQMAEARRIAEAALEDLPADDTLEVTDPVDDTLTDEELDLLTTTELEAIASGDIGILDGRPDSPLAGTGAVPASLQARAAAAIAARRGVEALETAAPAEDALGALPEDQPDEAELEEAASITDALLGHVDDPDLEAVAAGAIVTDEVPDITVAEGEADPWADYDDQGFPK